MLVMLVKRFLILVCLIPSAAQSQKPVIFPGGVVNAASYMTTTATYSYIPAHDGLPLLNVYSIASIFGTNLAASTEAAQTVPLPTRLAGTSVLVSGVAAPLFYVSPNQINFQIPYPDRAPLPVMITVSTGAGNSDPYPFLGGGAPGLFTQDASGCGPGLVFNVSADGTWSLNTPLNSASPGQFIVAYATGQGNYVNPPPAGTPAPG